jgi:hypothetical protein
METSARTLRRDPELEDVLEDLEKRLAEIEHVRTREYDDQLSVVEALAAPYALAFLHEIRRLDALLFKRRRRGAKTKRRTR